MDAAAEHATATPSEDRPIPPVQEIGAATLVLVVAGGIYTASHLPRHVPQGPTIALLAAACVLLAVNITLLARIQNFGWKSFRLVAGWVLAAYLVIAGMLEYAFVYDGTRGTQLVILTAMLVVFAINIPLLLGFSVARFEDS
jgi:hypothetical protein